MMNKELASKLIGQEFDPVENLKLLGYSNVEEKYDEDYDERLYIGNNPDSNDAAVITVGKYRGRYVYLEDPDGEEWRFDIYVNEDIIRSIDTLPTPAEALHELSGNIMGCKIVPWQEYEEDSEAYEDEDEEVITDNDITDYYYYEIHGRTDIEIANPLEYGDYTDYQFYVNSADAPIVVVTTDGRGIVICATSTSQK